MTLLDEERQVRRVEIKYHIVHVSLSIFNASKLASSACVKTKCSTRPIVHNAINLL